MLNKLAAAALVALALNLAPLAAVAQTPAPAPQASQVKTIWDYSKELGLTEKQTADIKAAIKVLQDKLATSRPKAQALNVEIAQLIEKGAPLDQIKARLQELSVVQIDLKLADIATARAINSILTKDQLAKWKDIQARARAKGPAQK